MSAQSSSLFWGALTLFVSYSCMVREGVAQVQYSTPFDIQTIGAFAPSELDVSRPNRGAERDLSDGGHAGVAVKNNLSAHRYPKLTSFLWYKTAGATEATDPNNYMEEVFDAEQNPQIAEGKLIFQLAFNPTYTFKPIKKSDSPLSVALDEMREHPGPDGKVSLMRKQIIRWSIFLKKQKIKDGRPLMIYLRPFAEMNDSAERYQVGYLEPWLKGQGRGSELKSFKARWPAEFVAVWREFRSIIDGVIKDEDGTPLSNNLVFTFNPTSTLWLTPETKYNFRGGADPSNLQWTIEAMKLMNRDGHKDFEALGIHPYTRGRNGVTPVPFAKMVDPWLEQLQMLPYGKNMPVVIGEMGVSYLPSALSDAEKSKLVKEGSKDTPPPQGDGVDSPPANDVTAIKNAFRNAHPNQYAQWDHQRAIWICEAHEHARRRGIRMITYFNAPHSTDINRDWSIDPDSQAARALRDESAAGLKGIPHAPEYCQTKVYGVSK